VRIWRAFGLRPHLAQTAGLLDALTTDSLSENLANRLREMRPEPGETARFYAWAMRITDGARPPPDCLNSR
jgi:hypothetical protein